MDIMGKQNVNRLRIAIQRDNTPLVSGRMQSFSHRWEELASFAGHEVVIVDAYDDGLFDALRHCDGFMWYFWNASFNSDLGKRLMLAIHHGMQQPTFPNWQTCWTFEDKYAQRYLLEAVDIPMPKSWVFWTRDSAREFANKAEYPLVMKLAFGITSNNVRLILDRKQAHYLIDRLFHDGMSLIPDNFARSVSLRMFDRLSNATRAIAGRRMKDHYGEDPIQRGCILFQEFLSNNPFDTRITVIGNRAFGFRRKNRPKDFRASGSGDIDWNPQLIDMHAVSLAFQVASRLGTQVVALDILRKGEDLVVTEISYYYEAWVVHECPGHWRIADSGSKIDWIDGPMRPDDAIFEDFVASLIVEKHRLLAI